MKKYFIKEWKDVLLKAYSSWGMVFVLFMLWASDIIYVTTGVDTNPNTWSVLLSLFLVLTYVGRILEQDEATKWRRRTVLMLVLIIVGLLSSPSMANDKGDLDLTSSTYFSVMDDMTVELVAKWEGKENLAYLDTIAKPPIWTVCYGHTKTAYKGMYKTDAECQSLLRRELYVYRAKLKPYFTDETLRKRLPLERNAAYTSFAYNVGVRGAGKSTSVRRLNKGDVSGACHAMMWWNKAGGRVVRGLVNRRTYERDYCMVGV